jgi:6-phosphogluconolactonase
MHLQTLTTLPADFAGENYCSDLRLSLDEKHLYVANRGHDNIVCFNVDAGGGELSYQSQASAHGHYPRILAPDPGGHFLLAAHQRSDSVAVFKIDPESGDLSYTGHKAQLDMPVHVLFA